MGRSSAKTRHDSSSSDSTSSDASQSTEVSSPEVKKSRRSKKSELLSEKRVQETEKSRRNMPRDSSKESESDVDDGEKSRKLKQQSEARKMTLHEGENKDEQRSRNVERKRNGSKEKSSNVKCRDGDQNLDDRDTDRRRKEESRYEDRYGSRKDCGRDRKNRGRSVESESDDGSRRDRERKYEEESKRRERTVISRKERERNRSEEFEDDFDRRRKEQEKSRKRSSSERERNKDGKDRRRDRKSDENRGMDRENEDNRRSDRKAQEGGRRDRELDDSRKRRESPGSRRRGRDDSSNRIGRVGEERERKAVENNGRDRRSTQDDEKRERKRGEDERKARDWDSRGQDHNKAKEKLKSDLVEQKAKHRELEKRKRDRHDSEDSEDERSRYWRDSTSTTVPKEEVISKHSGRERTPVRKDHEESEGFRRRKDKQEEEKNMGHSSYRGKSPTYHETSRRWHDTDEESENERVGRVVKLQERIGKRDEGKGRTDVVSGKRRHKTDSGSDEGFSDTETTKKVKYHHRSRSPVHRGPYRDLDAPEPETLPRYWDNNPLVREKEKSRSRSPVVQLGERYWDKKMPEGVGDESKNEENRDQEKEKDEVPELKPKKKEIDILTTRTGGAYIPPARLKLMQQEISDKSSVAYQRLAWEALKKSIHGLINKVNVSNIASIVRQLFKENIVRGRGLLCRSIMQAQASSQTFTHVYAALVAIINTKFPNIGELLLKRLILQFRRGFKRNDKNACISSSKFLGHLVNQQVAHELIALEILTLLLEKPTDDSVEIAIGFLKEVGMKLSEVSPRGLNAVFESLRHVLNEAMLDKRVQYMIEVMYQVRKDGFKDNPSVVEALDLVEEEDQMTHILTLEEVLPGSGEDILNVFKHDPEYEANEEKYDAVRREILGEDEEEEASGEESEGESGSAEETNEEEEEQKQTIIDETETNLTALRRTIYLTIQSSLDHNECAHKLMRMQLKPGQEAELCNMILDCCAQQRTYEKFFGLLAQRFCQIKREYIAPFEQLFRDSYDTIHRIDIGKLRNVAKLFGHLLFSDAISWEVLSHIHLNEEETTSSSRIFIKILFQELAEYMGLQKLNDRLKDATLQPYFQGLFPRDNPKNTRFSINFFTSIGLGGLTEDLRQHLANQPKPTAVVPPIPKVQARDDSSDSSSSDSSTDSSSDDSSSESSSNSTDSEVERRFQRKVEKLKEEMKKQEEAKRREKEKRERNRDKKRVGREEPRREKEQPRREKEQPRREKEQPRREKEQDRASRHRREEKSRRRRSRS